MNCESYTTALILFSDSKYSCYSGYAMMYEWMKALQLRCSMQYRLVEAGGREDFHSVRTIRQKGISNWRQTARRRNELRAIVDLALIA